MPRACRTSKEAGAGVPVTAAPCRTSVFESAAQATAGEWGAAQRKVHVALLHCKP